MSELFPLGPLQQYDGDGTTNMEPLASAIGTNKMQMRIQSTNVRDYPRMSQERIQYAIDKIFERGGPGCVRFGQEFWHGINRIIWAKAANQMGCTTYNQGPLEPPDKWSPLSDPISVNPHYWHVTHADNPAMLKGFNEQPDRPISLVYAERQGFRVAFINIQNFSRVNIPVNKQHSDEYAHVLNELITTVYHQGYNVVYGGDWNKSKLDRPHAVQIAGSAPDYLYALAQPKTRVRVINSWIIPKLETKLDHNGIGAYIEWQKV